MDFEIIISNKTSEGFFSLIKKYWSIDDKKLFIYSEKDLMNDYGLNFKEVVEENSSIVINYKDCSLCHSCYTIQVKSRDKLKEVIKFNTGICELCETYSPNYFDHRKNDCLDIKTQYDEISEIEKFILKGLVNLKSKMLIYKHIFNNDLDDKSLWKIINNLEKKGLIYIERNNECKIKSFKFPIEIIELLNKKIN